MTDEYIKELEQKIEDLERRNEIHDKHYSEMTWGTRGPLGDQPVKQVRLVDLSSDHLKNILTSQSAISIERKDTIFEILRDRNYDDIPEDSEIACLDSKRDMEYFVRTLQKTIDDSTKLTPLSSDQQSIVDAISKYNLDNLEEEKDEQ